MAFANLADAKNPVGTSNVELFEAPGVGKVGIIWLIAANRGTTDVNLLIKDATTTRLTIPMKAGAAFSFQSDDGKKFLLPANKSTLAAAVNVALSATGDVLVSAEATQYGG